MNPGAAKGCVASVLRFTLQHFYSGSRAGLYLFALRRDHQRDRRSCSKRESHRQESKHGPPTCCDRKSKHREKRITKNTKSGTRCRKATSKRTNVARASKRLTRKSLKKTHDAVDEHPVRISDLRHRAKGAPRADRRALRVTWAPPATGRSSGGQARRHADVLS